MRSPEVLRDARAAVGDLEARPAAPSSRPDLDPAAAARRMGAVLEEVRRDLGEERLGAPDRAPCTQKRLAELHAVERVLHRGLYATKKRVRRSRRLSSTPRLKPRSSRESAPT